VEPVRSVGEPEPDTIVEPLLVAVEPKATVCVGAEAPVTTKAAAPAPGLDPEVVEDVIANDELKVVSGVPATVLGYEALTTSDGDVPTVVAEESIVDSEVEALSCESDSGIVTEAALVGLLI
jgi:hypothetical protein